MISRVESSPTISEGCPHLHYVSRDTDTTTLQVPSTRRATLGDRAFRWLQRVHGTVCHQRHSEGRPSLSFFVSHTADSALFFQTVSRRLLCAVQQFFRYKL